MYLLFNFKKPFNLIMNYTTLKNILLFLITFLNLGIIVFFDICAKPQSDDWGFQAFIDEYGMFGSYLNLRSTFQTSPYMLVVMFPFILLQKVIPYFILLLIIQLSLPVSLFLLLKKFNVNKVSKWEELKVFLILFNISILLYLTAWNTNTFQNAVFWLTGALSYILPISMYIVFLERMMKANKKFIDKSIIFVLVFLLVGVQINYVVIFSLFFIFTLFFKVIQLDKFLYTMLAWGLISLIYTWSYPGWLNRIPPSNELDLINKGLNFLSLFFINFKKEPIWSLGLMMLILFVSNSLRPLFFQGDIKKAEFNKFLLLLFVILTISILFQIIAFNGNIGYGRVHFISHLCQLIFLFFLGINLSHYLVINEKLNILLLLTVTILILLPLKFKLYQAKRFSKAWNEREEVILRNKHFSKDCLYLSELPKSGILGYVDLQSDVQCEHFVGFKGELEYSKIKNYDHWVHKMHYGLTKNIIIQPVNNGFRDE
jgi:hypothetical protein